MLTPLTRNKRRNSGTRKITQVEGEVSATICGSVHLCVTLEQLKATVRDLAHSLDCVSDVDCGR